MRPSAADRTLARPSHQQPLKQGGFVGGQWALGHRLNILPAMSELSSISKTKAARPQHLDPLAVLRHARRLAQAPAEPWLHAEVAQRMVERLSIIKLQPRRVLRWSDFLGGGGAALAAAYPDAEQVCVEWSPPLLERSRQEQKRGWWDALRRKAEVQVLAPQDVVNAQFELVWANMCLHSSSDLPGTLAAWSAALAVDGFVMFSCIGPDSLVELRPLYAAQGWGRPAPAWWDMHDVGDLMAEAGFADPVMDQERISLTWADAESLLKDLRALGGNLAPERFAGCRGKTWHRQLLDALEGLRASDGRLHLSLELVFGHAFKSVPKPRLSAETSVSLEQMRAMVRRSGA